MTNSHQLDYNHAGVLSSARRRTGAVAEVAKSERPSAARIAVRYHSLPFPPFTDSRRHLYRCICDKGQNVHQQNMLCSVVRGRNLIANFKSNRNLEKATIFALFYTTILRMASILP